MAEIISFVASSLDEYQVIVTCDSQYTKRPFIYEIEKFPNFNIIGALLSDRAIY